jgi:cytochrome d ubiquinol oxidase subunit II
MRTVDNENILNRSRKALLYNSVPFVVFFLVFAIWLMLREGFAVNPDSGEVFMEPFKYLHNLLAMPLVLIMFLMGVLAVLGGIALSLLKESGNGIWFTGPGTVLVVFSLFMLAGFNHTAFYPSAHDLQSSLTIQNASSSHYTLVAMSWVSLFVPFVLAYIVIAWRSLNRKKIDEKEMQEESHIY